MCLRLMFWPLTAFCRSLSRWRDPAPTVVTASDWAAVISAMTSQISVSTVVGVLATLVTAGIGLVFLWWGVRKAVGSLMGSFRSGRIRL